MRTRAIGSFGIPTVGLIPLILSVAPGICAFLQGALAMKSHERKNLRRRGRQWMQAVVVIAIGAMGAQESYGAFGFSPPAVLNLNGWTDSGDDYGPQVTTDGSGNWVAVWYSYEDLGGAGTDWDIFVARSTDNGATWTAPDFLNTNATWDVGDDVETQLTTDGSGNWVAVWKYDSNLAGTYDTDILVARSTNAGVTWTAPDFLNTNAMSDSGDDLEPQVTTDGLGNWVAVWRSLENLGGAGTDWDIFVARSTNNGASWTAPALLNTNATFDSGHDYSPQLTTDGSGNWVAVWSSDDPILGADGDSDIFVARSTDNGVTWAALALLNTNATVDSGNDWGPQLTTDRSGNWVAVWYSGENLGGAGTDWDIFVARSTNNGASWTAPALLNTNATFDSRHDYSPQLTTDGSGNWVAVWQSEEDLGGAGTDYDIFVARSTDNGATWMPPDLLNTNATSDVGGDNRVQLTTDRSGNWVAVWDSYEDLGGAGWDRDIFVSVSSTLEGTATPTPTNTFTNTPTNTPPNTPTPGGFWNPSFEEWGGSLAGWTNNTIWAIDGLFPHPGGAVDGSHWASCSYGGGGTVMHEIYQNVTVTPGAAYRLSGYYNLGGTHGWAKGSLLWYDGTYTGGGGGTEIASLTWNYGGGGIPWTQLSGDVAPTGGTIGFIVRADISGWGGGVNADLFNIEELPGPIDTPTMTPTPGGFRNPSFEESGGSLAGWTNNTSWGIDGLFPNPGGAVDGSHWASCSYGAGGTVMREIYQNVTVTPGATYRLSGYYSLGGTDGWAKGSLLWYDGTYAGGGAGTEISSLIWNDGEGGIPWTELSGEVDPTGGTIGFIVRADISGWGGGVNVDLCSFEDVPRPPAGIRSNRWKVYR